jgi:serine/threonine protein kinase
MLVYEYVSNGTLRASCVIKANTSQFNLCVFAYLHELADPPIIHRGVQFTNILLDDHLKGVKVADLSLSKLVSDTYTGE